MQFIMNEGEITLPFDYEDCSMSVMKFTEQKSTLVITRGMAPEDLTLQDTADMQVKLFKREFKTVTLSPQKATMLGERYPAIEFFAEFIKGGLRNYQINLLLKHQAFYMTWTLTQNRPFTQEDIAIWQEIKSQFIPSEKLQSDWGDRHERK